MKQKIGVRVVTVFGLGKSGIASAKKLVSLGAKVFASDASSNIDPAVPDELRKLGVGI